MVVCGTEVAMHGSIATPVPQTFTELTELVRGLIHGPHVSNTRAAIFKQQGKCSQLQSMTAIECSWRVGVDALQAATCAVYVGILHIGKTDQTIYVTRIQFKLYYIVYS